MLKITSFQVEHLSEGCVTDCGRPAFSWYAECDRNDNEITEAVLQVGEWKISVSERIAEHSRPAILAGISTPFSWYIL